MDHDIMVRICNIIGEVFSFAFTVVFSAFVIYWGFSTFGYELTPNQAVAIVLGLRAIRMNLFPTSKE